MKLANFLRPFMRVQAVEHQQTEIFFVAKGTGAPLTVVTQEYSIAENVWRIGLDVEPLTSIAAIVLSYYDPGRTVSAHTALERIIGIVDPTGEFRKKMRDAHMAQFATDDRKETNEELRRLADKIERKSDV